VRRVGHEGHSIVVPNQPAPRNACPSDRPLMLDLARGALNGFDDLEDERDGRRAHDARPFTCMLWHLRWQRLTQLRVHLTIVPPAVPV